MSLVDHRITAHAAGCDGAITRASLLDYGLSSSSISRRVQAGALRRARQGVYIVTAVETSTSDVAALVLGIEGSVASHQSAAVLHGMNISAPVPTVSVRKGHHVEVTGCRVFETRSLPDVDRQVVRGMAATTAARTLCDLAPELHPKHLRQLVQEQTLAGRPSMPAVIACHQALARRGRTGTVAMRTVLASLTDDEPYPESRLELIVAEGLAVRRVSGVHRQYAPPWYDGVQGIVDFADPRGQTIIEADGRAWHTLDRHASKDRGRTREALRNGWVVVRVGWAELTERTEATFDDVVAIIDERRAA